MDNLLVEIMNARGDCIRGHGKKVSIIAGSKKIIAVRIILQKNKAKVKHVYL
jgi:D-aminopeptidase